MPEKSEQPRITVRKSSADQSWAARFEKWYRVIAMVVFGLVVGGGYLLFVHPALLDASSEQRNDVAQLQEQKAYLEGYLGRLEKMVDNLESVSQQDVAKLSEILPDEKGIADLFVQFDALAKQHGFVMESIAFAEQGAPDKSESPVQRMSIGVTLSGPGYPALKALLASVEKNLRLLDVNAVYFTPGSPKVTLNVYTYYLTSAK